MASKQADYTKQQAKASSIFNLASMTFQEAVENLLNGTQDENEVQQQVVDALGENGSIAPILESLKGKSSVEELNLNLVTGTSSVISSLDSINQTLIDIKMGLVGEKLATGPMVETMFLCWQDLLSFIYGEKIDPTQFGAHADKAEKPDKSMFNTLNSVSLDPKIKQMAKDSEKILEQAKELLTLNFDKLYAVMKDVSTYTGGTLASNLDFQQGLNSNLESIKDTLISLPKNISDSFAGTLEPVLSGFETINNQIESQKQLLGTKLDVISEATKSTLDSLPANFKEQLDNSEQTKILEKISDFTGSTQVENLQFKDAVIENLNTIKEAISSIPDGLKKTMGESAGGTKVQNVRLVGADSTKAVSVNIVKMSDKIAEKFKGESGEASDAAVSGSLFLTATADAIDKIIHALRKFRKRAYKGSLENIDQFLFNFALIAKKEENKLNEKDTEIFTKYLKTIQTSFDLYNALAKASIKMMFKAPKVEMAVETLGEFLRDFKEQLLPKEDPKLLANLVEVSKDFDSAMKDIKKSWKTASDLFNSMGSLTLILKLNLSDRNIKQVMKLLKKFTSSEFQNQLKQLNELQPSFTRSTEAINLIGKIFKAAGDISKSSVFIVIGAPFTFIALKITKTIIKKALKIASELSQAESDFKDAMGGIKAVASMMKGVAFIGLTVLIFGVLAPKMSSVVKGLMLVMGSTYTMVMMVKMILGEAKNPDALKGTVKTLLGLAGGIMLLALAIIGISKIVDAQALVGLGFIALTTFALIYIVKYAKKLLAGINTKEVFMQLFTITGAMVIVMLATAAMGLVVASLFKLMIGGIIMFGVITFALTYIMIGLKNLLSVHNRNKAIIRNVLVPILQIAGAALLTVMIVAITGLVAMQLAKQVVAGLIAMGIVLLSLVLIIKGIGAIMKNSGGIRKLIKPLKNIVEIAILSLIAVMLLAVVGIVATTLMPAVVLGMIAMIGGMVLIAKGMKLLKKLMKTKDKNKITGQLTNVMIVALVCALGILIMWGLSKLFKLSDIPGIMVFTIAFAMLAVQMYILGKLLNRLKLKKLDKDVILLAAAVLVICISLLLVKVLMGLMPDIIPVMVQFGVVALMYIGIMFAAGKAADRIKKSTPILLMWLAGSMVVIALSLLIGSLIAKRIDMEGMVILGLAVMAFTLLVVALSYMQNAKLGAIVLGIITACIIGASVALLILVNASQKFTPAVFISAGIMVAIVGLFAALAIGLGVPYVAAMALLGAVVLGVLVGIVLLLSVAMMIIINTVNKIDKTTLEKAKQMKPIIKQVIGVLDVLPAGSKMIEKSISLMLFSAAVAAMAAAMGKMAKMVQEYASLTIPEYQGTQVVAYRKLDEKDFTSAANNIRKIITTVGGAIIATYEAHPEMFKGSVNTPFEITVRSVQKLGRLISKIARGVQDFAAMQIAVAWGKDSEGHTVPTKYRHLDKADIDAARTNVAAIITTLSEAIMTVYNSDPTMFDEGLFTSSPYSRTVKAVSKLGRLISKIAKGVQDFASMKVPTEWGKDKDGYTQATKYAILSTNLIKAAQNNIVSIITTLSDAIMTVYNQDPAMFDGSNSPYVRTVKAVSKLGMLISSIAKGVLKWAAMQVPVEWGKDKDGNTQVTKYALLTLDQIDSAKNNVVSIVTTLSSTILDLYEKHPEMFDGGSKSPYVKTVNAVSKLGKLITSIAKGVQNWAAMKVPSGYKMDKDGVLQVTGYELLTLELIDSAKNNVNDIVLTLCTTLMDLYNKNPQFFDKPFIGDSPFNLILNSTTKMGKMIRELAKGIQAFANLRIPVYGTDKDGNAQIKSYISMTPDDISKATANIQEIILCVAGALALLFEEHTEFFDKPFLGNSPFAIMMDTTSKMGDMISEIAKGVQSFAELKIPVYSTNKDGIAVISSYNIMTPDDVTAASENIKMVIVTVAQALADVYNENKNMFEAPFLGSTPFTKVMEASTQMGDMISCIAEGVQAFAELKLPVYGQDKDGNAIITSYNIMKPEEITTAADNIKSIILTIASAISQVYEDNPKMFDAPFLGSTPFTKVMDASTQMGDMIKGIAEGIQAFANLKMPIYGQDKEGLATVVNYEVLQPDDIDKAAENIQSIILLIAGTLADLYEDHEEFFKDPFLGSSPFKKMMESTGKMGDMIKGIAEGIQAFANLKMPIYGTNADGVAAVVDYEVLKPEQIDLAALNISQIILLIATTLADLYEAHPDFFKDPFLGSSPYKKMMESTGKMGDMIKGIASGIQEFATMKMPEYGLDKEGVLTVTGYKELKESDITEASKNIGSVITLIAQTLVDLYESNPDFFKDPFLGTSKFKKMMDSVSTMGKMVTDLSVGVKAFALLQMPIWGQDKETGTAIVVDYKEMTSSDFTNAGKNIGEVIKTIAEALCDTYDKHEEYFKENWFSGPSKFKKILGSVSSLGSMVVNLSEGIQAFAELSMPIWGKDNEGKLAIVDRKGMTTADFLNASKNIGIVIKNLADALIDCYNKNPQYFQNEHITRSGLFGLFTSKEEIPDSSPIARVVKAIGGIAGIVDGIANGIVTFANGSIPEFDEKGNVTGRKGIDEAMSKKCGDSIGTVVKCLVEAFVSVLDNPKTAYLFKETYSTVCTGESGGVLGIGKKKTYERVTNPSPVQQVVQSLGGVGALVGEIANAIVTFASGTIELYDERGNPAGKKNLGTTEYKAAADTILYVTTTLVKALVDCTNMVYQGEGLFGHTMERRIHSVTDIVDNIMTVVGSMAKNLAQLATGIVYFKYGDNYEKVEITQDQFTTAATTAATVITTLVKAIAGVADGKYKSVFDEMANAGVTTMVSKGFWGYETETTTGTGGSVMGVIKAASNISGVVSRLAQDLARLATGDYLLWGTEGLKEVHIEPELFTTAASTAATIVTTLTEAIGKVASGPYKEVFDTFGKQHLGGSGLFGFLESQVASGGSVQGVLKTASIITQIVGSLGQRLARLASGKFLMWNGQEYEERTIEADKFVTAATKAGEIIEILVNKIADIAGGEHKDLFEAFAKQHNSSGGVLGFIESFTSSGGPIPGVLKTASKITQIVGVLGNRLSRFATGKFLMWNGQEYEERTIEFSLFSTAADKAGEIIETLVNKIADIAGGEHKEIFEDFAKEKPALNGWLGILDRAINGGSGGSVRGVLKTANILTLMVSMIGSRMARFATGDYVLWVGNGQYEEKHIDSSKFIEAGHTAGTIMTSLIDPIVELAAKPEYQEIFEDFAKVKASTGSKLLDYILANQASGGSLRGVIRAVNIISGLVMTVGTLIAKFAKGDFRVKGGWFSDLLGTSEYAHIEPAQLESAAALGAKIMTVLLEGVLDIASKQEYQGILNEMAEAGSVEEIQGWLLGFRSKKTKSGGPVMGIIGAATKIASLVEIIGMKVGRIAAGKFTVWENGKFQEFSVTSKEMESAATTITKVIDVIINTFVSLASKPDLQVKESLFANIEFASKCLIKTVTNIAVEISKVQGTNLEQTSKYTSEVLKQLSEYINQVSNFIESPKLTNLVTLNATRFGFGNTLIFSGTGKGSLSWLFLMMTKLTRVMSTSSNNMAKYAADMNVLPNFASKFNLLFELIRDFSDILKGFMQADSITYFIGAKVSSQKGDFVSSLFNKFIERNSDSLFASNKQGSFAWVIYTIEKLANLISTASQSISKSNESLVLSSDNNLSTFFDDLKDIIGLFKDFYTSPEIQKIVKDSKTKEGAKMLGDTGTGSIGWLFKSINDTLHLASQTIQTLKASTNFVQYEPIGEQYKEFFTDMKTISEELDIKKSIKFETLILSRYQILLRQLDKLVPRGDLDKGAKAAKGLIIEVNKLDMNRAASFTTLLRELNMLSQRLGGLDKFTHALTSTLANTLNKLTTEIANSALIIDKADEILEERAKRIKDLISQINSALAAPIQVTPVITEGDDGQSPAPRPSGGSSSGSGPANNPGTGYDDTSDDFGGGSPSYEAPSQQVGTAQVRPSTAETEVLYQALSILKRLQSKILSDS